MTSPNKQPEKRYTIIDFAGHSMWLDAGGAIFWPGEGMLIVSDMHLEKGSFLAQFGSPLPLYDTHDTLSKLGALMEYYRPKQVLCLGDSFHDARAVSRLGAKERQHLYALATSVDRWIWILGNHDKTVPPELPGENVAELHLNGVMLVHEPLAGQRLPQIGGHFHPKLRLSIKGARVNGKVFAHDGSTLLMPSFGSYTGGLDVRHEAVASLLRDPRYYLLYKDRIWKV